VKRRARGIALALAVAAACNPAGTGDTPSSTSAVPLNTCSVAADCAKFAQPVTPGCNGGRCLVSSGYTGLVLVVALSADSYFAPGQTFAIPYTQLFTRKCPSVPGANACAELPALGIVEGAYIASSSTQQQLGWNLGNPGIPTAVPVHVTYRPLWQPGGPTSAAVDAASIGLPLGLVDGYVVVDTSPTRSPGPGGGVSIGFQGNLQPALYEVTIQPDPPFDGPFPPYAKNESIGAGSTLDVQDVVYDVTKEESGPVTGTIVPTFDLGPAGGLVGWTAYLRDQTTRRRTSALATLGTKTSSVLLPTNHQAALVDALTTTELVVAPPPGSNLPTYVVAPTGNELPEAETVPALPPPTTLTGTVTDADGVTPVAADLVFEVMAAGGTKGGIYVAGSPPALNTTNFEFAARAHATLDAAGDTASFSVDLPPGQYQLTLRPADGGHAVTVQTPFAVPISDNAVPVSLVANATQPVSGGALLADGRLLAGALVEALPAACAAGAGTSCLPRQAQTATAADGTFSLALDPGTYTLQIQPAQGSGFPWVTEALLVGPTPVIVPPAVVPAPVSGGFKLHDPYDNPLVSAVVRVFQVPSTGQAVELGRAITDTTGAMELYLAPSTQ
jgi:hypothetical protein